MHKIINGTGSTIPAGRIVKHSGLSVSIAPQIKGATPQDIKTGFPNLYPGASGKILATCKGLAACKLWIRGIGILSNDLLVLAMGDSAQTTRNTFTLPLLEARTDAAPTGTIDLTMILDDAVTSAKSKDALIYGVTAAALPDKGIAQGFVAGDSALVEFVEMTAIAGKYICPDDNGKARYYDPMADKGAMVIGQLDASSVITVIGGIPYVNVTINPLIP